MIDYMKRKWDAMATKTWQNIRFSEKGNPDGCSYALFGSCCAARDSKHFRHSLRLRLALVSHNWILDLFFLFRILRPREKNIGKELKNITSLKVMWLSDQKPTKATRKKSRNRSAKLLTSFNSLWVLLHERLKKCIVSSKGFMSGDSRFVSRSLPLCKRELVGQKKKWKRQGQKQNNTTRRPSSGKPESNYHKMENNFFNKTEVLRRLG